MSIVRFRLVRWAIYVTVLTGFALVAATTSCAENTAIPSETARLTELNDKLVGKNQSLASSLDDAVSQRIASDNLRHEYFNLLRDVSQEKLAVESALKLAESRLTIYESREEQTEELLANRDKLFRELGRLSELNDELLVENKRLLRSLDEPVNQKEQEIARLTKLNRELLREYRSLIHDLHDVVNRRDKKLSIRYHLNSVGDIEFEKKAAAKALERIESHLTIREGREEELVEILRSRLPDYKNREEAPAGIMQRYETYHKNLQEQMDIQDGRMGVPQGVMHVTFTFDSTFENFVRYFNAKPPPFVKIQEKITSQWRGIGTFVDMGIAGNKMVVARHVMRRGVSNPEPGGEKFLTITLADPRTGVPHEFPVTGFMEFTELDLAAFDVPPQLSLPPLVLERIRSGEDEYAQFKPVVSHIYTSFDTGLHRQPVQVDPWRATYEMRARIVYWIPVEEPSAFLYINSRVIPGDSGSPLISMNYGVIGFALALDPVRGGGIAIKAARLLDILEKFERPQ